MPTVIRILGVLWIIHTRDHGYPHVTVYKGSPKNFEAVGYWRHGMKSTKKKSKIKYGTVEMPEGFDDPRNHKVRITMWIDGDLLQELKERAQEVGAGYQTYTQKLLRDSVFKSDSIEQRLKRLEKALKIKTG